MNGHLALLAANVVLLAACILLLAVVRHTHRTGDAPDSRRQ